MVLHLVYKGLNFLDMRNEKGKQENVIPPLRTMKQQHYWNNELYKCTEVCQEGGEGVILRIRGVDYHQKVWNQTLAFKYYASGKLTKIQVLCVCVFF